jgi:hypothetical protein
VRFLSILQIRHENNKKEILKQIFRRECIFKQRVWNGVQLQDNDDNGVSIVNFAVSKI